MQNRLVSTYELSRIIAKQIDTSFGSNATDNQGFMQKTILKVVTTFCKFISHLFKKEGPSILIAEVPAIG